MGEKCGQFESQLESDVQQNDICLLTGELASLYVYDVSIASLANGHFCFFTIYG